MCLGKSFSISCGVLSVVVIAIIAFAGAVGGLAGDPRFGDLIVFFAVAPSLSFITICIGVAYLIVAAKIICALEKDQTVSQLRCLNCANIAALFYFFPVFIVTALITWFRFRKLPVDSRWAGRLLVGAAVSLVAMVLTSLAMIPGYVIKSPFGFNPYVLIASLMGTFFCIGLVASIAFVVLVENALWRLILASRNTR